MFENEVFMKCIVFSFNLFIETIFREKTSVFFISFLISSQFNQIRQLYRLRANLKKKKKIKIKSLAKLLFHREKQIKKDNTTRIRWKRVSKKKRNKIEFLSLFFGIKNTGFCAHSFNTSYIFWFTIDIICFSLSIYIELVKE